MAGAGPPSGGRPRLTERETAPAPAPDLSAHIQRAQAQAGAAVHRPPAPEPIDPVGEVHPDAAVALVRAMLPVAEVTVFVDRGEDGWKALGTGESPAWG